MAFQFDSDDNVSVSILPNLDIQNNNLEKYLDYIKEQETDYCIGQEEVTFIQSGIENLVQTIYDRISKNNESRTDGILKVGSFYEGTKNKFPDEFDFIFVLAVRKNEEDSYGDLRQDWRKGQERKNFHTLLKEGLHKDLVYPDNALGKIYFKKFVKVQGPSSKLMFIYKRNQFEYKTLHVDIVPAFKIDKPLLDISICNLEPFRDEILRTGSYLLVGLYRDLAVSFTETEVHFVKNILSRKHFTVYKLLKFLLGGHGQAEIVRDEIPGEGFSTYMIKTAIIRHHYECENTDSEDKGPCLITVLQSLLRYKRQEYYPILTPGSYMNWHGESEYLLERIIGRLRRMQKSSNRISLCNRWLEVTPVGKQRLKMYRRERFWKEYKVIIPLAVGVILIAIIVSIAILTK